MVELKREMHQLWTIDFFRIELNKLNQSPLVLSNRWFVTSNLLSSSFIFCHISSSTVDSITNSVWNKKGGKKGQRIGESEKRIRFRNHTGWRRGPWRGWVSRADHPELGARGSSLRLPPFRREPARRDRRQRVEGSALRPFGVDASGVRAASRTRGSGDGGRLLGWTVGPVEDWSPKKSRVTCYHVGPILWACYFLFGLRRGWVARHIRPYVGQTGWTQNGLHFVGFWAMRLSKSLIQTSQKNGELSAAWICQRRYHELRYYCLKINLGVIIMLQFCTWEDASKRGRGSCHDDLH